MLICGCKRATVVYYMSMLYLPKDIILTDIIGYDDLLNLLPPQNACRCSPVVWSLGRHVQYSVTRAVAAVRNSIRAAAR